MKTLFAYACAAILVGLASYGCLTIGTVQNSSLSRTVDNQLQLGAGTYSSADAQGRKHYHAGTARRHAASLKAGDLRAGQHTS